jgi:predicted phage terminase large subunit-like protein
VTATLPADWRTNPKTAAATLEMLRRYREKTLPPLTFRTPGDLAKALNPKTVQTPALDLIDEAIADAYQTPNARLIICMPPQEGKSQRATKTGTLWNLIRNPDTRVGVVSYAADLAKGFGYDIRNWIQDFDGTDGTLDLRLRIAPDNGAAARWSLAGHEGGVVCVGIGGGLTGRPLDALIIDDPFADAEQADSATYRDKVWNWWTAVGSTRLAPGSPVILIMTRWHEDDLAGRLLKGADGSKWKVLNIPAQADHDPAAGGTDPLGRQPGEFLSSARRRTEEEWEGIKLRSGSRVWGSLYQGRPSPETGNVWKRHWWGEYETALASYDPETGARFADGMDEVIQSWDFTFKDTKASDFVVGQVWGRRGAQAFLLDQTRSRMTFTDSVAAMVLMTKKWPQATLKLVEDKANGTAIIDTLRAKVGGIVPVEPHGSKLARANAVSPYIEAGNVKLPSATLAADLGLDIAAFKDEAASFPNASHDDQVDAASQALARLYINGAEAWLNYMRDRVAEQQQSKADAIGAAEAELETLTEMTPEQQRHAARQAAFTRR